MNTIPRPVTAAIPVVTKVINMLISRKILLSIFLFLSQITVAGQVPVQTEVISAEGRITYLTADRVYCDIGSENGSGLADTLQVYRRNEQIGLIVVTNVARNSSVCEPLVPIDMFQLGDRVRLEKTVVADTMIGTSGMTIADTLSPAATVKDLQKTVMPLKISQSGVLSARYTVARFSDNQDTHRGIGTLQYTLQLNTPLKTQFWIYGRSNLEDRNFTVYQARAAFGDRRGRLYAQIGRVFSSQLSGVGATDGVLLYVRLNPQLSLGGLLGLQPQPYSLTFNSDVKKAGVFIQRQNDRTNNNSLGLNWEGTLALVGQYANGEIDREFLYDRFRLEWKDWLALDLNHTVDLYRGDPVGNRKQLELTSNQLSLRMQPFNGFRVRIRYSGRKRIYYRISAPDNTPDSLFVDALRYGWFGSLQYAHSRLGSVIIGTNLRFQSASDNKSTYIYTSYFSPVFRQRYSLDVTGSYIQNLVVTGTKYQVGLNANYGKWGNLYGDYEIYIFGYGNIMTDYKQHNLSVNYNRRFLTKLYGTAALDWTIDQDYTIIYLYFGITVRL